MVYMFYVYEFLANLFNFDYDLFILEGISCGLERFDVGVFSCNCIDDDGIVDDDGIFVILTLTI